MEKFLRLPDVRALTARSKASIYRDIASGNFPPPVKTGPQSSAWPASAIDRWMSTRLIAAGYEVAKAERS